MDKKTYAAIRAAARKRIADRKSKKAPTLRENADSEFVAYESVDALMESLLKGDE